MSALSRFVNLFRRRSIDRELDDVAEVELAGRGDKTLGTILGAVGGGVLGRAIDRGDLKCR